MSEPGSSAELLVGLIELEGLGQAHTHAVRTELVSALEARLAARPIPWWAQRRIADLQIRVDGALTPGGLITVLADRIYEAIVEANPEALLKRRAEAEAREDAAAETAGVKTGPGDA